MNPSRFLLCEVLTTVLLAAAAHRGLGEEPKRFPVPRDCIQPEIGYCHIAGMDFGEEGDRATGDRSALMLFEDGKPLGPPRSVHQDIREKGKGRYSHWTREGLYFSASDNTDPRTNGRRYEVASTNPKSTLGGLARFPARPKTHVEEIDTNRHEYRIEMGGTLDAENTKTLSTGNCLIAFQSNLSLTIENVGDTNVVNPRLVLNDRGNWYTFEDLLSEFTRGAATDQDKAYFIWQSMRENLYHETPLFANDVPHDPVRLMNFFGFNLCDDAGNAGCSVFHHAGLVGSKNRALNGHVQCEACVGGKLQFMDIDMDCFYLDRENERPVSGDACARDHDLVRRELNYGRVVSSFESSEAPAALFGPDDRLYDAQLRGHAIAYTLRPGEKADFRWDNAGKYCAESQQWAHRPKYFGNSKFVFRPRLDLKSAERDAAVAVGLAAATAADGSGNLAGTSADAYLVYRVGVPYAICGGTVRAGLGGKQAGDRCSIAVSLDGKTWKEVWTHQGAGVQVPVVTLDAALDVLNQPAKYGYFVRIGLGSVSAVAAASLDWLEIETDVMAAPASLPRLQLGANHAVYRAESPSACRVRITHEWQESDAVKPLPAIASPEYPQPGATIRDSVVTFSWPALDGARQYHFQVSRRPEFRYPYRPSLDVVIPTTKWCVPYTGTFSPDTTYYWRLRCCDPLGVWGAWSEPWTFQWQGPRVPVDLRVEQKDQTFILHWQPNPRGERPAKYEVYGSDQKGFSVHKDEHHVPGRGKAPANFLGETSETSMVVASPLAAAAAANRVYYRVVAIDGQGTASGCSDYVELPHPLIYSRPTTDASAGQPYRYAAQSFRSLGDYQNKPDPAAKDRRYDYRFWDVEENRFAVLEGPKWLTIDAQTGTLSGTPSEKDAGKTKVRLEVKNQFGGRAEQEFELKVGR
ncbi:MAG: putative Ig domain-containing protein [Pirellulales bacterium]|nr:putative Ig domain-containing protein [Pirellulales bacterium]